MSNRKMPDRSDSGARRFQIDLHPNEIETIASLMERCALSTKKDLFNNALVLFEWAVGEIEKGHKIAALNPTEKTFAELRMPSLVYAEKAARKVAALRTTEKV